MGDQQVNILLVGEVEKYPILYNFTLPGYSNKDETQKAWNKVGKAVNMTVAECKERWKNLRAVFTRNMKCFKSGSAMKTKKAYYLLEAMQFTLPYIKALGTPSGISPRLQQQEKIEQFEENVTKSTSEPSSSQKELQSPPPQSVPSTQTDEISQQAGTAPGPSSSNHIPQRKRFVENEEADKACIDYFQAKKPKILKNAGHANQNFKYEGLKMFLLSMLPDLLKMSDAEVRHFKRKALETIDDIMSPQMAFSSRTTTPSSVSEMLLSRNRADVSDEARQNSLCTVYEAFEENPLNNDEY